MCSSGKSISKKCSWERELQGKSHPTDIFSEAANENNIWVASLNTVDLLCSCSHSHHTLLKRQAFIPVQKERVILFATLLSCHRSKVLILVTAAQVSAVLSK